MSYEYMANILEAEGAGCKDQNCKGCPEIEDCFMKMNDECNMGFAKSIGYGGYTSEEEFWNNI